MKKTRILLTFTLTLICLAIISIISINTFSPEPAAYCAGNIASANGSGHHKSLTLSFGAFDHGEGNITGQATFIDEAAKTKITIDVECVSSGKHIARVGGRVQKSTNPSFMPGSGVSFDVEDNGEGEGASSDRFTLPVHYGCNQPETEAAEWLTSDAGNIQVRFLAPDKDCTKCPVKTHCKNGDCVGGGNGGGGISCPPDTVNCGCACVQSGELCPVCPEDPGK